MSEEISVRELSDVVVLFTGDSGDGMQLVGNMFSEQSAVLGNDICTFPDYPAEIRAPQGTLGGVSGYRVHVGAKNVLTPGDKCDVLVAMNPAALKRAVDYLRSDSVIVADSDTFTPAEMKKALYQTNDAISELNLHNEVIWAPLSTMCVASLSEFDMPQKNKKKCKNIMALGLICWLFNRKTDYVEEMLRGKFKKKPEVAEANIKVLHDGYNYGHNIHATVTTYHIESKKPVPGIYTDINGNKATAYGLIAAAEKAGMELFLGSYPITPASDILHELAKHKSLGVKTVQCEDEISGCCMSIGASFAGDMAVTSTSGPGLALKSEGINLAVMAELPLVVIDVQRGGPSTGLPTKTEQTDLLQALYGRNGESPIPVVSAKTPCDCFDAAYWACKVAQEHVTPVILLTDAFIANGSAAWKLPDPDEYPSINSHLAEKGMEGKWSPYLRDPKTFARYRSLPGMDGFTCVIGGLEKDSKTGGISYEPKNHEKEVEERRLKVKAIANDIPLLEVQGEASADTLLVGWGGTYGHLLEATNRINAEGKKIALVQFGWIKPLPLNTEEVLTRYKHIIVAELNGGQFAGYLRMTVEGLPKVSQYDYVEGQPFVVDELVDSIEKIMEE